MTKSNFKTENSPKTPNNDPLFVLQKLNQNKQPLLGVLGEFSDLKFDLVIAQSIDGQGELGSECSTKCGYFHRLSPGVHGIFLKTPLSQKSVFFWDFPS